MSGYIDELTRARTWLDRHPRLRAGLTTASPAASSWRATGSSCPRPTGRFDSDRLFLEVSLLIRVGDVLDHPWRATWPYLRELVDRVGADQLLWGTDMPFQDRFCTHRQSRDLLGRYASLADGERTAILGGSAARLLGL